MRKQPRLLESAPFAFAPSNDSFSFSLLHLPTTVSLRFSSLQGSQGGPDSYQRFTGARCGAWRIFEPEHLRPTVEKLKCRLVINCPPSFAFETMSNQTFIIIHEFFTVP
jgi:hypothetical protein